MDRNRRVVREWPSWALNLGVALFLVAFANQAFFRNLLASYPPTPRHLAFVGSIAVLTGALILLLLTLIDTRFTRKPVLVGLLLVSSATAHFMDRYNVVIDVGMLRNVAETDTGEALDLLGPGLLLYVLLLGILPSLLVLRVRVARRPVWSALRSKLGTVTLVSFVVAVQLLAFNKDYASFFRGHKALRYYANPLTCLHSAGKYVSESVGTDSEDLTPRGADAAIPAEDVHRELLVLVIGETARADRFSLNGYSRPTNPRLAREHVLSLPRMTACGTSTAIAVPCMFSGTPRDEFDRRVAAATENLLDVLVHAGVHVLWRDNNTGSKGVADRVEYQDFRVPENNPVCDVECRDEGMLAGLQAYIDGQPEGDICIVLHQMGNHGPAYYRRYPEPYGVFVPVCRTTELGECTAEEINNAYDNAIVYTDRFLAQVIDLLKRNDGKFETGLFYVSDHGESLGEHGIYLHGLPNLMAPDEQTNVAALLWFGESGDIDLEAARAEAGRAYSHENVFHTVLGLFEIRSSVYDPALDILASARREPY